MPYQDESDLKYIDELADIPLTGPEPDSWTTDDKLEAAESAEEKLEADVYDGRKIPGAGALHATAANAWASYLLVVGAEHPKDATSEVFAGGSGEDVMEFAHELKNIYHETKGSIQVSDADEGTGTARVSSVDF
ncbi:hypothetical protein [Haloarcula onubensis]|uniref:Uncharacterized protein n=1 Tax=Haloarcula onubensis TaxID=2950539 RepID=A0ABU2FV74_9EURY|nr:hypothetical protein [Halomicroarcula sp. S3CR25-11]MDS0284671.1 hypothetical protein [Halomicroarcula sp. S3CR25-11]